LKIFAALSWRRSLVAGRWSVVVAGYAFAYRSSAIHSAPARSLIELLDHQLIGSCDSRPVNVAWRIALDILAQPADAWRDMLLEDVGTRETAALALGTISAGSRTSGG